jgi:hypothetical protein
VLVIPVTRMSKGLRKSLKFQEPSRSSAWISLEPTCGMLDLMWLTNSAGDSNVVADDKRDASTLKRWSWGGHGAVRFPHLQNAQLNMPRAGRGLVQFRTPQHLKFDIRLNMRPCLAGPRGLQTPKGVCIPPSEIMHETCNCFRTKNTYKNHEDSSTGLDPHHTLRANMGSDGSPTSRKPCGLSLSLYLSLSLSLYICLSMLFSLSVSESLEQSLVNFRSHPCVFWDS